MVDVVCDYCGKTFKNYLSQVHRYKTHYCSTQCKGLSKKGKAWGGAISMKGKTFGKYGKSRVDNMALAKKQAFIQKALSQPNILQLDKAREVLKNCYCTTDGAFKEIMNYPKGFKWATAARYLLEKEGLQYKNYIVAEPISTMNVNQIQWFEHLLTTAQNYYDFQFHFRQQYKKEGVRKSAEYFKNILDFLNKTKLPNNVLNKFGEKNRGKSGSSIEYQVRLILDEIGLPYKEQVRLSNNQRVDFVCNDVCIEVNGDYWHGDLNCHSADDVKRRDKKKLKYFNDHSLTYLIIWEHDLKKDLGSVFSTLKQIIKKE